MWWVGPVPTGWGLWSWPCLEAPPHLPMPTVYLASLAAQGLLFCSLEWGVKVQDCRKDPSPTGPQVCSAMASTGPSPCLPDGQGHTLP